MTWKGAILAVLCLAAGSSGCRSTDGPSSLPSGAAAYDAIPVRAADDSAEDAIRVGDRLAIRVLGEPELTSDLYRVDSTGFLQVPLAGELIADGQTPAELRDELVRRLGSRYIRDPQVAVIVVERRKTTFAVEGEVRDPGTFEIAPNTTLISALAQAKSPTNVAKLDEVMIFRIVNGERMGARFNLAEIRKGNAADPQVLAGDTVVVGYSAVKGAWREFLQAAPVFNLFYIFR